MDKRFAVTGVTAATPLRIAAPAMLLAKAGPLFALEDAARGGADADAVHDMRVASRRLREAMRVLAPLYPRRDFAVWYRTARRITRALGPVRDSDVFIEEFSAFGPELGAGGARAVAFMVGFRAGQRVAELERLNERLARLDLTASRRAFEKAAYGVTPGTEADRPLGVFAHAAVAERAAVVFGAQPAALDEAAAEAQHALRIDYKRLRYAVEAFAPCYGGAFDGLHRVLTAFQDVLGEIHDLHVFSEMLAEPERRAVAAVAGVAAADLAEVEELIARRSAACFARFAELAAAHPAESLLPALLLPLAKVPQPEPPATAAAPPSAVEDAGGAQGSGTDGVDVADEASVVAPVLVGDEPWAEGWGGPEGPGPAGSGVPEG